MTVLEFRSFQVGNHRLKICEKILLVHFTGPLAHLITGPLLVYWPTGPLAGPLWFTGPLLVYWPTLLAHWSTYWPTLVYCPTFGLLVLLLAHFWFTDPLYWSTGPLYWPTLVYWPTNLNFVDALALFSAKSAFFQQKCSFSQKSAFFLKTFT